jgi:hypothetical protein
VTSQLIRCSDRAQISLGLATHHVFTVPLLFLGYFILLPLDRLLNVTGRPQLLIVVFWFRLGDHIRRATLVERLARECRGNSCWLVACATERAASACCPELRRYALGRRCQSRQPPLDTGLRGLDW